MSARLSAGSVFVKLALAAGCVSLIVVGWTAILERVSYERRQEVEGAIRDHSNLAFAFEEHTAIALDAADQAARLMKARYEEQGALAGPQSSGFTLPGILNVVGVADERGRLVIGSPDANEVSVADRDYFQFHRDHADPGLRIGKPIVDRVSGRETVHLTYRIGRPDGSFAGVAIAGVNAEYFTSFYQQINLDREGLIELVGLDGMSLVRRRGRDLSYGNDMRRTTLLKLAASDAQGSFVSTGGTDGVRRYISYRRLAGFPAVVAVGESVGEILAPSREREHKYYIGGSIATIALALLWLALSMAIGRRQKALAELRQSESLYRATFDQAAIGVAHSTLDGTLTKLNATFCDMLGYREEELAGRSLRDVMFADDYPLAQDLSKRLSGKPGAALTPKTEIRFVRKDGAVIWTESIVSVVRDPAGKARFYVGMAQDITERKRAEALLEHQAYYDELTDLPNRRLCYDRLDQALTKARRMHWSVGVLFVDLDRFKAVNDSLGHIVGDRLLRKAGQRLRKLLRAGDTVARVGADGFVIVLPDLTKADDGATIARKVLELLSAPFDIEGHEIFVTASVGIATSPPEGCESDALLRNANAAMSRAKSAGRGTFQFYTAAMNDRAMEKLVLEADLRRALERDEFVLHFQPKLSLASGELTGFEALIRWNRGGKGLVPPGSFVPVLEDSGLIAPVGEWIIASACRQIRDWQASGLEAVPVAVNVGVKQFLHQDIVGVIERALLESGIAPRLLEVEITESDAMHNPDEAVAILTQLRERHIRVAIDDFGTGYSSLGYLKRLPVDALKIDRSFVTGLPGDPDDASIARAVIAMAHSLGLKVVAEGVETEAQRQFLAANGCDQMQGYLFSRPVPAADCERFLAARVPAFVAPA